MITLVMVMTIFYSYYSGDDFVDGDNDGDDLAKAMMVTMTIVMAVNDGDDDFRHFHYGGDYFV